MYKPANEKALGLLPTFHTWSQVSFLHLYLLTTRLRLLPAETSRQYQHQLIDAHFFAAETKMDIEHNMASRVLRQKYLKDLFVQWRGVQVAYDEGLARGEDSVLAAAVWRNLFRARADVDVVAVAGVVGWMRRVWGRLEATEGLEELVFEVQGEEWWAGLEEEVAFAGGRVKVDMGSVEAIEAFRASQAKTTETK